MYVSSELEVPAAGSLILFHKMKGNKRMSALFSSTKSYLSQISQSDKSFATKQKLYRYLIYHCNA